MDLQNETGASVSALNSAWGDKLHLSALFQAWNNTSMIPRAKPGDLKQIQNTVYEWLTSLDHKGLDALTVLHKIVAQSSEHLFAENVSVWWQQVISILLKKNCVKLHSLALMTIRNLIQKSTQFQSVNRVNCSNIIHHILECIRIPQIRFAALDCLAICLKHHPGTCSTYKNNIESELIALLDTRNGVEMMLAAKCMAWLPLAGGGITQQQASWKQLQIRLLSSLHLELDTLFEQIAELPMALAVNKEVCLPLSTFSEKRPVARVQQLERRFHHLCQYLTSLLVEPVPVTKSVLVEEVLQFVCRGLAVTGLSVGTGQLILELQTLKTLLPSIHCSVFRVLDALILILGKNLIPYHSTILKLILGSLKWTRKEKHHIPMHVNAFSELRTCAYRSLILYLQETQISNIEDSEIDELLFLIIPDITPHKETVALRNDSQQQGKNRKRKQMNESIVVSAAKTHITADSALCAVALETLIVILQCLGCLLKPEHHKVIHQSMMPAALDIQRGGSCHPLYQQPSSQLKLMELLLALVLHPHPQITPLTSWAVAIFTAGQRSYYYEVSQFSKNALRLCESLSHPAAPSVLQSLELITSSSPLPTKLIDLPSDDSNSSTMQNTQCNIIEESMDFNCQKRVKITRDDNNIIPDIIQIDSPQTEIVTVDSISNSPEGDVYNSADATHDVPSSMDKEVASLQQLETHEIVLESTIEQINSNNTTVQISQLEDPALQNSIGLQKKVVIHTENTKTIQLTEQGETILEQSDDIMEMIQDFVAE